MAARRRVVELEWVALSYRRFRSSVVGGVARRVAGALVVDESLPAWDTMEREAVGHALIPASPVIKKIERLLQKKNSVLELLLGLTAIQALHHSLHHMVPSFALNKQIWQ